MAKTTKQQAHTLISYYVDEFKKQRAALPPRFNRFSLVSGFECMIMDYGYEHAQEIIDYYLTTPHAAEPHSLPYKYGDIHELLEVRKGDSENRRKLWEQTVRQMKEHGG